MRNYMTVAGFLVYFACALEAPFDADPERLARFAKRCRDYATIALNSEDSARRDHARLCAAARRSAKTRRAAARVRVPKAA
jgi:hypothetical protein